MDTKKRILVDGDACPVRREVERVAERLDIDVLWFANSAQDVADSPRIRAVQVSDRRDAADFALVSACRQGDVVVTDDLGLAAMALGAKAEVLSSRGRQFRPDAMAALLEQRHTARKVRRAGGRTSGPKALSTADRGRFQQALENTLRPDDFA